VRARLADDHQIEADTTVALKCAVDIPERMPTHVSDRIDRLLLHPWLGLPIFFVVMLLLFQAVFRLGEPLQRALGQAV
jgi:ferrous iron transport protein B